MGIIIIFFIGCLSGLILFSRALIKSNARPFVSNGKVSVIIPARNEEHNLPYILDSLMNQTYKPYEIIVVDDFSQDGTKTIANQYGVKTIANKDLPIGWTGKTWAVWNGFKHSSGDILVFLDADIRLKPHALELLLIERERSDGVISVVPYHYMEKFYEKLSLITNILGLFAFTSPFERKNCNKGLYGSCIIARRDDYEKVGGHESIKTKIMDDLNLGMRFTNAGIKVKNFIGYDIVSFRMYPKGIVSEVRGFAKGAVLGAAKLRPTTVVFIVLWLIGLVLAGFLTPLYLVYNPVRAIPFVLGYILYTIQIFYYTKYTGNYGIVIPILHLISTSFFLLIIFYSFFQVTFLGYVFWKGRNIYVASDRTGSDKK